MGRIGPRGQYRMVRTEQIQALIEYLETQPGLALGYCSKTTEGRAHAARCWTDCSQILNTVDPNCPKKTPAEWRTFYNEFKSRLLKKVKDQQIDISQIGCPTQKQVLTPMQERLLGLLGQDVWEPVPTVRQDPLSFQMPNFYVDIGQENGPKFEPEDESQDRLIVDESLKTEISPTPSTEPPPVLPQSSNPQTITKRRHRATRKIKLPEDYVSLEAKLERMETAKIESTLERAQATNNLAAAIDRLGASVDTASLRVATAVERIGDIISNLVSAPPPKKRRRRDDSEAE